MECISHFWREWKCLCRSGNSGRQKKSFLSCCKFQMDIWCMRTQNNEMKRICYLSWNTWKLKRQGIRHLPANEQPTKLFPTLLTFKPIIAASHFGLVRSLFEKNRKYLTGSYSELESSLVYFSLFTWHFVKIRLISLFAF